MKETIASEGRVWLDKWRIKSLIKLFILNIDGQNRKLVEMKDRHVCFGEKQREY